MELKKVTETFLFYSSLKKRKATAHKRALFVVELQPDSRILVTTLQPLFGNPPYIERISCRMNTVYDTPKQITVMAMRLIR